MNEMIRESVLRMAAGAIEEKVDYEVSRVIDNCNNGNRETALDPVPVPHVPRSCSAGKRIYPAP